MSETMTAMLRSAITAQRFRRLISPRRAVVTPSSREMIVLAAVGEIRAARAMSEIVMSLR